MSPGPVPWIRAARRARVVRAGVAVLALASCGDPAALRDAPPPPDDAATDAPDDAPVVIAPPSGLPDLQLVASQMTDSWLVSSEVFPDDDCAVQEGCLGASGRRLLLRFDTVTANRGTADVDVGPPPPPGVSNEMFQWSPCHKHHHVTRYTSYELVGSAGTVLTARKQAFCLEDAERDQPAAPSSHYTCLNQGISRGWADSYGRGLPCQWIDITDVPPGTYTLRIAVNPDHTLPESDYSNNLFSVDVHF